jgi:hypothetical protein
MKTIFCKHDWELISETVTKSRYEVAMEAFDGRAGTSKVNLPWQLCDASRKHIQTFTCRKCGKLKRFVEEI